jgi:hypothetical protein
MITQWKLQKDYFDVNELKYGYTNRFFPFSVESGGCIGKFRATFSI